MRGASVQAQVCSLMHVSACARPCACARAACVEGAGGYTCASSVRVYPDACAHVRACVRQIWHSFAFGSFALAGQQYNLVSVHPDLGHILGRL